MVLCLLLAVHILPQECESQCTFAPHLRYMMHTQNLLHRFYVCKCLHKMHAPYVKKSPSCACLPCLQPMLVAGKGECRCGMESFNSHTLSTSRLTNGICCVMVHYILLNVCFRRHSAAQPTSSAARHAWRAVGLLIPPTTNMFRLLYVNC